MADLETKENDITMEDFERAISSGLKEMRPGDIVKGTVIGVSDTEVTVDLNAYAEGIIKIDELSNDPRFSIKQDVKIGDEISALVLREDREGHIILSAKQADDILAWDKLKTMMNEKAVVSVKIREATNAGVITFLEGIRAFIPSSKLSLDYVTDTDSYVGKTVDAQVITVDEANKKLVLSVRDVLKDREIEARNSRIAMLPVGSVVNGKVERIEPYGAFVSIGNGLQGLVHVSQISEKRLKHPKEVLSVGQDVSVKIIDVKEGKISLSIKAVNDKDETEEELETVPATYTFGDDEPTTMAGLFKGFKFDK